MRAEEARAYGMVDEVISSRALRPVLQVRSCGRG
jgi:hypothetical protein